MTTPIALVWWSPRYNRKTRRHVLRLPYTDRDHYRTLCNRTVGSYATTQFDQSVSRVECKVCARRAALEAA